LTVLVKTFVPSAVSLIIRAVLGWNPFKDSVTRAKDGKAARRSAQFQIPTVVARNNLEWPSQLPALRRVAPLEISINLACADRAWRVFA
jgi:hypothetical protein